MTEKPLEELKELLATRFDELTLLEILQANTFDIVERFSDIIEDDMEKFNKLLDEDSLEEYSNDED